MGSFKFFNTLGVLKYNKLLRHPLECEFHKNIITLRSCPLGLRQGHAYRHSAAGSWIQEKIELIA